jgi:uncharacterized membrane protein YhfC
MAVFDILVRASICALTLAMPFGLFAYLFEEIEATWRWIGIGAATFFASKVVDIPLNSFVLMPLMGMLGISDDWKEAKGNNMFLLAVLLGLSAGICEEVSRYLVYCYWLTASDTPVDQSWKAAVSLGAGYGGCEAIIVGVVVISDLIKYTKFRNADLYKLVEADKVREVQEKLDLYWSMPWYELLMPFVDGVSALTFHMSAAVLVLQVFQQRNMWWLGAAVAFHATMVAVNVVASVQKWNKLATAASQAVLVIPLALKIIFHFQDARSVERDEASVQEWNISVTEASLAVLVIISVSLKIIFHFRDDSSVEQEEEEALQTKKKR